MKSRNFIDLLLDAMPCRQAYDFRIVDRPTGGWVIKIGELVDAGIKTNNAATIWEEPNGAIKLEIYERGSNYHYWPETSIDVLAREVCEFCERKMSAAGFSK